MQKNTSKVYVKVDKQNRILCCEGGYTTPNDLTDWVLIDEGSGDKYNLCQSHYFDKPIYTNDGVPRYKLVDGKAVERTEEEINAERLPKLKQSKITALSATCEQTIYNGLELELSENTERFEYKDKDQTNIKAMFDAVVLGAEKYPYQSEDGNCRVYTAQDIITLYTSLEGLRTAQLTYYHQIKDLVNTLETVEEINAVTYGQELEGEYLQHYIEMLAVAQEQMQLVLSKVVQNAI